VGFYHGNIASPVSGGFVPKLLHFNRHPRDVGRSYLSRKSGCGKSHQIGNEKRASVDRSDQLPDGRILFCNPTVCEYAVRTLELRNFGSTDLPLGQTRTSVLYSRANCEDFFNSRMIS